MGPSSGSRARTGSGNHPRGRSDFGSVGMWPCASYQFKLMIRVPLPCRLRSPVEGELEAAASPRIRVVNEIHLEDTRGNPSPEPLNGRITLETLTFRRSIAVSGYLTAPRSVSSELVRRAASANLLRCRQAPPPRVSPWRPSTGARYGRREADLRQKPRRSEFFVPVSHP